MLWDYVFGQMPSEKHQYFLNFENETQKAAISPTGVLTLLFKPLMTWHVIGIIRTIADSYYKMRDSGVNE